jgi:PAS domain S-box-containing protein
MRTLRNQSTNGQRDSLDAAIIIANAPDPVFVSDLEGKILQANDAVSELLGFRCDELLEQSLSGFISAKEKREFTAALRAVVEHGVTGMPRCIRAARAVKSFPRP